MISAPPKSTRSVIVTGDDFGISRNVNRAILEAHQRGILTSASLMVTGEAFDDAVALARRHPGLAVGLHLVLVSGRSVLPPERIPHLVDRQGWFSSQPFVAGLRCQLHPAARRELRLEIRAQLEKFRQTGLPLSHVDGHRHLHLPPAVLRILIELAGEFGIRAIRLPSEDLSTALRADRTGWVRKTLLSWTFSLLRRGYAQRLLESAGMDFSDRVYGLLQDGRMTEEYLLALIPALPAGRVEIYSHPTTEEGAPSQRLGSASRAQLSALLSGRVREALVRNGWELSTTSKTSECTGCLSYSPSFV